LLISFQESIFFLAIQIEKFIFDVEFINLIALKSKHIRRLF